ncbi:phBC6A51 family helix-turn-helix protein [Peribacillus butanolivorans]|uniref:TetR family transcriptional regulator n=1 Tax=Peribacillus butanolivorans TaxID=421767 RepID=A0ABM6XMX8_9BACI|nr:phBC6A51 family helix-turn-helix protein [Peribacillus butanolivorans]AXN39838.1 TetR family transcriptional regulator [Peribacillus butanolivorans]
MALTRLNPEHITAINYLAQPHQGGLTIEEIAKEAGVSRATIFNWRKEPLFERELKREMVRLSQDRLPELIQSLSDIAIRDGNAAMAKLALQINGMLTDKVEIETKDSGRDIDYDALDSEIAAFGSVLKDVESNE